MPENINYIDISCFSKTQASEINICENVKYMRINNLFSGKFPKNLKTISYANCSSNRFFNNIPQYIENVEFVEEMHRYNDYKKIPKTVKKIIYNIERTNLCNYFYLKCDNTVIIQHSYIPNIFDDKSKF